MTAATPLVVVTPWYPTDTNPYAGSFVRETVMAQAERGPVTVVHVENVPPEQVGPVSRARRDGVDVVWVPVATGPLTTRADMATNQRDALAAAALPELADAQVVHAHVGMPTGWAVAQLLPPSARMVLTEHSSTVNKVMRLPETRAMYGEALARAGVTSTVSEFLARALRSAFPEHAASVLTVPNIVRAEAIPMAAAPRAPLRRWLYVGNLLPAKGVLRVMEAFVARAARPGGDAFTLTMAGGGPCADELAQMAARAGLTDRVQLLGPVPPEQVPQLMAQADVLVHLSAYETFGMTVLEALAAGLVVVSTRSGGPVETLGEAVVLDRARLVEHDDTDSVLDAMAELEDLLPGSDPQGARDGLLARYSPEAVGRRFEALLRGTDITDDVHVKGEPTLTVLGVGLHRTANRALNRSLSTVVEAGGAAIVLTTDPSAYDMLGPAVTVIDLRPVERRFLPHAVERLVVWTAPVAVLKFARRASTALLRRAPTAAERPLERLADNTDRVLKRYARFARHRHPRLYARVYEQIAPWWLARRVFAGALGPIDLDAVDVMFTADWRATPFAWRVIRACPDIQVRRPMSRQQVARAVLSRRGAAVTAEVTAQTLTDPSLRAPLAGPSTSRR